MKSKMLSVSKLEFQSNDSSEVTSETWDKQLGSLIDHLRCIHWHYGIFKYNNPNYKLFSKYCVTTWAWKPSRP